MLGDYGTIKFSNCEKNIYHRYFSFHLSSCRDKDIASGRCLLNEKVNAMSGDSDGDADLFDADNQTPKGAAVAGNGVALDSDGDGIPNYKDSDVLPQKV